MEIASFVISIISFLFTGITVLWAYIDRDNRHLKYKICTYIYEFYQPTYMVDQLPTTEMVNEKFNSKQRKYKKKKIEYLLIELSLENKIIMSTNLSSPLDKTRWRPNVNLGQPLKVEITKMK